MIDARLLCGSATSAAESVVRFLAGGCSLSSSARAASVLLMVVGTSAIAKPPAPPTSPASPAPAITPAAAATTPRPAADAKVTAILADQLANVALVDLRLNPAPERRDFAVALVLLQSAADLRPDDAVLLRLAIDAAAAAEDRAALDVLLRRLVKLDPADTSAQLALINRQIQNAQTVKERQELYERFLGPRGQSLDPAIRSRLAFDAALLARERGDNDGFLSRLLMATQLDETNAEAAGLYADVLIPTLNDAGPQFELLTNVLMADPLDYRVHMRLGRFLAGYGAPAEAVKFFELADTLSRVDGSPGLYPAESAEIEVQRWLSGGAEGVANALAARVDKQRKDADLARAKLTALNLPTNTIPAAADLQLPLELQIIRLTAHLALQQADSIKSCLKDLSDSKATYDKIIESDKAPDGLTIESVKQDRHLCKMQHLAFSLWAGEPDMDKDKDKEKDTEKVKGKENEKKEENDKDKSLSQRVSELPDDEPLKPRLMAMVRSATDMPGALADLDALGTGDSLAMVTKGWLLERAAAAAAGENKPDHAAAIEAYKTVCRQHTGTLSAAFAETRLKRLGAPPVTYPAARSLASLVTKVPAYVPDMIKNPRRRASIILDATSQQLGPLDRAMVRIRLKNASQMPLAVGPDRTLSSRALLAPSIRTSKASLSEFAETTPVSMDRKPRLRQGEEMVIDVWADAGFTSWAVGNQSSESQRLAFRLLQGFRIAGDELPRDSDLGFSGDVGGVVRSPAPAALLSAETAAAEIAKATGADLLLAAAAVRPLLVAAGDSPNRFVVETVAALLARYKTAAPAERAALLCLLPNKLLAPACRPFDEAVLVADDPDPTVRVLTIVTRCNALTDRPLAMPAPDSDAAVRAVATLQRQRIETKARVLATTLSTTKTKVEMRPRDRDQSAPRQPLTPNRAVDDARPARPTRPAGPTPR
jgi:hypothetical protein